MPICRRAVRSPTSSRRSTSCARSSSGTAGRAALLLRGLPRAHRRAPDRQRRCTTRDTSPGRSGRPTGPGSASCGRWAISVPWGSRSCDDPRKNSFLDALEITPMTRSFKMLVLRAMLEAERFPGDMAIQDLSAGVRRIARRSAPASRRSGRVLGRQLRPAESPREEPDRRLGRRPREPAAASTSPTRMELSGRPSTCGPTSVGSSSSWCANSWTGGWSSISIALRPERWRGVHLSGSATPTVDPFSSFHLAIRIPTFQSAGRPSSPMESLSRPTSCRWP